MTARVDVSRCVFDQPQESHERPAPEQSRFQTAHRGELICNVVVFEPRQSIDIFERRSWRDLHVSLFATPQLYEEDRQIKKNQWAEYQQQDRHKDQVQQILYAPCQWSFSERSQLKSLTIHFLPDEFFC